MERQERLLREQIEEVTEGIEELKNSRAERFTIKSMERTKKGLETKLKKLLESGRKDDVVTFEELGVDRLYVDEAHAFKNLFTPFGLPMFSIILLGQVQKFRYWIQDSVYG